MVDKEIDSTPVHARTTRGQDHGLANVAGVKYFQISAFRKLILNTAVLTLENNFPCYY